MLHQNRQAASACVGLAGSRILFFAPISMQRCVVSKTNYKFSCYSFQFLFWGMHWKALSCCLEVWPPEVFWKKLPSHLSVLKKKKKKENHDTPPSSNKRKKTLLRLLLMILEKLLMPLNLANPGIWNDYMSLLSKWPLFVGEQLENIFHGPR